MKKTKGLLIVMVISGMMLSAVACGKNDESDRNYTMFTSDGREDNEIVGGAAEDAADTAKEIGKDAARGAKNVGHDAAQGVEDLKDTIKDGMSNDRSDNRSVDKTDSMSGNDEEPADAYRNVNSVTAGEE